MNRGGVIQIALIRDFPAQLDAPRDTQMAATPRSIRHAMSRCAHAAVHAMVRHQTGRSDWRIMKGRNGKPLIAAPDGTPGPAVSLSHTAGLIAAAITGQGALGIDAERHRPRNFPALAENAFGPREMALITPDDPVAFYRVWTLREALAKATGDGLALAANRRDLVDHCLTGTRWLAHHAGTDWTLFHPMAGPEHSLSVAHDGGAEVLLEWIEFPSGWTADVLGG
jgi:phosphopantetheinyl transferase